MARRKRPSKRADGASGIVWREAEDRAKKYGLDAERVRAVLEQLERIGWFTPNFPFDTAFDEAVSYVGSAKALEVFENEDLEDLSRRVSFLDYLQDDFTPSYTLEELADLTEQYISYVQRNRSDLVQTGFPGTDFERSRWFDWHHTKTYFVKVPVILQGGRGATDQARAEETGDVERDEENNLTYSYTWAHETPFREVLEFVDEDWSTTVRFQQGGYSWHDRVALAADGRPVTYCSYEEAAYLPELNPDVAARVEKLREKVVDLKIAVLRELLACLRRNTVEDVWQNSLSIMTEVLLGEDAVFLLETDKFYEQNLPLGNGHPAILINSLVHHNAGLSELLLLIGHVEKELRIGTMENIRGRLFTGDKKVIDRVLRDPRLPHVVEPNGGDDSPLAVSFTSYYESIGKPWRKHFDDALEEFFALEPLERAFWVEFEQRVNDALENEFCDEIVLRTKVKRKLARAFKANVGFYSEWVREHLHQSGTVPQLKLSQVEEGEAENVFRKEGEYWTLRYKGDAIRLKNSKGLQYVHRLLSDSPREISVFELAGSTVARDEIKDKSNVSHDIGRRSSTDLGHAGDVMDARGLDDIRNHLEELETEHASAVAAGDGERAVEAAEKIDQIKKYLSGAEGLGRRRRKSADTTEKARKAVSKCINSALDKIKNNHPSLWRHLDSSIHVGRTCWYRPSERTDWVL